MSTSINIVSGNLGFPRMGNMRQLKFALERFWTSLNTAAAQPEQAATAQAELLATATKLRAEHWQTQQRAGIDIVPSNDFSMYDHVLDTAFLFGCIPERHRQAREQDGSVGLRAFFAMARGFQGELTVGHKVDVPALPMTKWFDSNYHYVRPEIAADQAFTVADVATCKPVAEFAEALALGIRTRPVLVGPVTFLLLSKVDTRLGLTAPASAIAPLLTRLVPAYVQVIAALAAKGAQSIQIDEPALVLDLTAEQQELVRTTYAQLAAALKQASPEAAALSLVLTTYYDDVRTNLELALQLPVQGLHIDAVRGPQQVARLVALIDQAATAVTPTMNTFSVGVVDGRNIWKASFQSALALLQPVVAALERLQQTRGTPITLVVAPSSSLLTSPHTLESETALNPTIKNWLSFAVEKLHEVVAIKRLLVAPAASASRPAELEALLQANVQAHVDRANSSLIHNPTVQQALRAIEPSKFNRKSPFAQRFDAQQKAFNLPLYPTTTIGSFPQTAEVRSCRARYKAGKLTAEEYDRIMKEETKKCIELQESWGLDVLVTGEFERTDMVEFFGEQMQGYVFTKFGWVQSYGSRCVKPPIIYGDISRPTPMTVELTKYAASLTSKQVKGMLTGPITCLQWSFVRNDQPRDVTARQLALAIREEVHDLEAAGITIIQIDEPAIREGLPLHKDEWDNYLQWSVDAFKLSSTGVEDSTQIHTHMCYSDFQDILPAIARMDADVLTIENARSDTKLLEAFCNFAYPNMIGPGLYDIHSPRVPSADELLARAKIVGQWVDAKRLWINPDCGLKTRGWKEVEEALRRMCQVAIEMRRVVVA